MKITVSLLLFFCTISFVGISQDKPDFKIYCDKQWSLIATEEFGVESVPEENMKKDEAFFSSNGTAKLKMFGKEITGKWLVDKTLTYLTITDAKGQKTVLKIYASANPQNLTLEYKDPDYVKTKMIYEPKK